MANMQEMMDEAEQYLIHTYNRHQIVLDKGEGVYLYDVEGKQYLDFGAGIAVFALGYNNKEFNNNCINDSSNVYSRTYCKIWRY